MLLNRRVYQCFEEPCLDIKFSGSQVVFLILNVKRHFNYQELDTCANLCKEVAWESILDEGFKEKAHYISSIRIFSGRSRRILALSRENYVVKFLDKFNVRTPQMDFFS